MTRRIRFQFWALASDLVRWLGWYRAYLRCVEGMAAATDFGEGAKLGEEEPF
jgi:hypothetical protein